MHEVDPKQGLLAIILAYFNDQKAEDIFNLDAKAYLSRLSLDDHISQQRANGIKTTPISRCEQRNEM